jgi:hypothetical protein
MQSAIELSPTEVSTLAAPSSTLPVETTAVVSPAPAVTPSETAAIISMIERASRDPAVDLDKMERLIRMRKEMVADEAERAFAAAMRSAQAEMRPIGANAVNPQTRSRYATYDKLDRELRPIYTRHGFSLSFDEQDCPKPDHIRVVCYVSHEAGHTRTYRKDMPADGKGAKGGDVMTKTHATGAAASYGARYLLKGIFNIAVGEEDRDGNEPAPASKMITEDQVAELQAIIDDVGGSNAEALKAQFLKWAGVKSIADIPAKNFRDAVAGIESRRKKA